MENGKFINLPKATVIASGHVSFQTHFDSEAGVLKYSCS